MALDHYLARTYMPHLINGHPLNIPLRKKWPDIGCEAGPTAILCEPAGGG
jgi:hypothetical protein